MHEPPQRWERELAEATAIYISHQHSDHLSPQTLRVLAQVNPNVLILIPDLQNTRMDKIILSSGMKNIVRLLFGVWHDFGIGARCMILRDALFDDLDSMLLVDYCGHLVINTVDCNRPNGEILPCENADLLVTDFAGGASSFPQCWFDMISDEKSREMMRHSAAKCRAKCSKLARITHPGL